MDEDMAVELAGEVPEIMAGEDTSVAIITMVMSVVTGAISMIIVVEKLQGMAVARIVELRGYLKSVARLYTLDISYKAWSPSPNNSHTPPRWFSRSF